MSRYFNNKQKGFVWGRQNGKCGDCGSDLQQSEGDYEYHHILNWKNGGDSSVENCVLLCKECHYFAHDGDYKKDVALCRQNFQYANWDLNKFAFKYRIDNVVKNKTEFTRSFLKNLDGNYINRGVNMNERADAIAIEDFIDNLKIAKKLFQEDTEEIGNYIGNLQQDSWDDEVYLALKERFQKIYYQMEHINNDTITIKMISKLKGHIEEIKQYDSTR